MNGKGPPRLQAVGLTEFDENVFKNLAANAGEIEWYPETKKPLVNELIDVLVRKRLLEITNASRTLVIPQGAIPASVGGVVNQYGSRLRMRLTDEGRAVLAALLQETPATSIKLESAG